MVDTKRPCGSGLFFLIDIVYTHEGAGECRYLAKGDEEGFVDFSARVNIDAAVEHYEAADGKEGGGEELDGEFVFHIDSFNSVL